MFASDNTSIYLVNLRDLYIIIVCHNKLIEVSFHTLINANDSFKRTMSMSIAFKLARYPTHPNTNISWYIPTLTMIMAPQVQAPNTASLLSPSPFNMHVPAKPYVRKRHVRWASQHTEIQSNKSNGSRSTLPDGIHIECDTHTETMNMLWYSQNEFEEFLQYNQDLVTYALQTGPQRERDWVKLEHALNMHGHSLRGLERNPGMPQATLRDEKHEMAVYGLIEACKMYKNDIRQISMVYGKLTAYSKQVALLAGEDDLIAVERCPDSKKGKQNRRLSHGTKEGVNTLTSSNNEGGTKARRGSLAQEIVKSIKRMPRRLSLKSR